MDKSPNRPNNIHLYNEYILRRTSERPPPPRSNHPPILLLLIFLISASSLLLLFSAIVSKGWLCTQEREALTNETALYLQTCAGLWTRCSKMVEWGDGMVDEGANCSHINHFERKDANDLNHTESILVYLRNAIIFIFTCFLSLCVGFSIIVLVLVRHNSKKKKKKKSAAIVSAAVMHIMAGLFLFISLIIAVVAITDQDGNNNEGERSKEFPMFIFQYGTPFKLIVATFVGCKVTAVLAIHFYFEDEGEKVVRESDTKSTEKMNKNIIKNENEKLFIKDDIKGLNLFSKKGNVEIDQIKSENKLTVVKSNITNNSLYKNSPAKKSLERWRKLRRVIHSRMQRREAVFVNEAVNSRICEKLSYHFKTASQPLNSAEAASRNHPSCKLSDQSRTKYNPKHSNHTNKSHTNRNQTSHDHSRIKSDQSHTNHKQHNSKTYQ